MDIAIIALTGNDADEIVAHLLRLSPEDRSLRFAAGLVTDDMIRRYVAGIRFGHDAVIGLIDRADRVVGLAHGCRYTVHDRLHIEAAFSVDAAHRRRRHASCLMTEVLGYARRVGASSVEGLCAVRNLPMRRVFEHGGMQLTREDDEIRAHRCMAPRAPTTISETSDAAIGCTR